jgi:hypothetical protein
MMFRTIVLAAASIAAVWLTSAADAAARKVRVRPAPAPPVVVLVEPVQDCSAFYDDYARRGFGWGSGPGTSVGFGTFEGALPRYPKNSFPNWYGSCVNWGHYSATGSGRR